MRQYSFDQRPQRWPAGQIVAIARQIDPGQHDLAVSCIHQRSDPVYHDTGRHRPALPASEGDGAEGTTVVAPVLHLDERPDMVGERGDEMRRRLAHLHDVTDDDRIRGIPGRRRQLVGIADNPVHFGHRREAAGVDLRRATRHDDLRRRSCPTRTADRGAGLLHRGVRHRAAIDDDHVAPRQQRPDRLAFGDVEAATEADDLGQGSWHGLRSSGAGRASP